MTGEYKFHHSVTKISNVTPAEKRHPSGGWGLFFATLCWGKEIPASAGMTGCGWAGAHLSKVQPDHISNTY